IGTVVGAALAMGATQLIASALPAVHANVAAAPTIGLPVALFSIALMLALGLLTGLRPALRAASRRRLHTTLTTGRRSASGGRGRDTLVVVQIGLALTLLVCALLLTQSMTRLQRF